MNKEKSGMSPILRFCDALFITNTKDKKRAAEIAHANGGIFRKYGVNICTFDPKTGTVIKWKQNVDGFSVWKPIPKEEAVNSSEQRLLRG